MGVRFTIEPRMLPARHIARRLGLSLDEFEQRLPELLSIGFPAADPLLGTYCLQAVDSWIDRRAGLINEKDPVSAQAAMLQAVRDRAWAK